MEESPKLRLIPDRYVSSLVYNEETNLYETIRFDYEPEDQDQDPLNILKILKIYNPIKKPRKIRKKVARIIKPSELENIAQKSDQDRIIKLNKDRYIKPYRPNIKYPSLDDKVEETFSKVNKKTGAQVQYVSASELPSGNGWKVLGMYDPRSHTIYIADNLSERERLFVYYHEEAHATGIIDEAQADDYAAKRVGYNLRAGDKEIYRKAA